MRRALGRADRPAQPAATLQRVCLGSHAMALSLALVLDHDQASRSRKRGLISSALQRGNRKTQAGPVGSWESGCFSARGGLHCPLRTGDSQGTLRPWKGMATALRDTSPLRPAPGFQDRPGSQQPLPRHGYQEAQGSEAGPAQAGCWPGCLTAAPASQPLLGEGEPTSEKANWGQPLARKSPC